MSQLPQRNLQVSDSRIYKGPFFIMGLKVTLDNVCANDIFKSSVLCISMSYNDDIYVQEVQEMGGGHSVHIVSHCGNVKC